MVAAENTALTPPSCALRESLPLSAYGMASEERSRDEPLEDREWRTRPSTHNQIFHPSTVEGGCAQYSGTPASCAATQFASAIPNPFEPHSYRKPATTPPDDGTTGSLELGVAWIQIKSCAALPVVLG